ncbi:KinB-signaling pathway activation protein [Peribacillus frigoritolerans]|uniref:KinB-signaling pathway activation protein n=1 Tax=Peribacillus frigoritolerans TaxID=450367 RepID=UPI001059D3DC|nr:KinB-signaling pathway activation protein [Peribacillus frigoritolerans]TDL75199.1 KinB-signaling pathway activation protein [Peribacillus frigoritolerans]
MNSRNWVRLFLTTLLVGGISTSIVGFALRWGDYQKFFISFDLVEILSILFWLIGVGFIFSIISQMGFFAYLTIHRFGLGIFKTAALWNAIQIVLILFVVFDLIYFRYQLFAAEGESILSYILLALFIVIFGLAVAYIKMQQTNKRAFIPALFFMIVVTSVEWVPALRVNEGDWLYLMLIPLLICNAYQLLLLTKYSQSPKS